MRATILILCEHFGQIRGSTSYTCISLAQLCLEVMLGTGKGNFNKAPGIKNL